MCSAWHLPRWPHWCLPFHVLLERHHVTAARLISSGKVCISFPWFWARLSDWFTTSIHWKWHCVISSLHHERLCSFGLLLWNNHIWALRWHRSRYHKEKPDCKQTKWCPTGSSCFRARAPAAASLWVQPQRTLHARTTSWIPNFREPWENKMSAVWNHAVLGWFIMQQ